MNDLENIGWVGLLGRIGIVVLILVITWVLARVVKTAITRLVTRVPALDRGDGDGESLGASLGTIASLVVWLFGLVTVLNVFQLESVLQPITVMLQTVLGYLPNILGAAFVFVIGLVLARIVRQLVETALRTVDLGRFLRAGMSRVQSETGTAATTDTAGATSTMSRPTTAGSDPTDTDRTSTDLTSTDLANTAGAVVFGLVMIVVTIASLQILGIAAVSEPATRMLTAIFDAVPNILAAALLLAIGVFIARFAGDLLRQILTGLGVDRALHEADVLPRERSAVTTITTVAQVALVLFFAVMAAQLLGFPQITAFLSEVLGLGGRVLFGGAIIAAGFSIAGLLARLMAGSTASQVVRYATLALFVAMGLSFMGIADSIVQLAFGAVVVGAAAAAALAFGLGGREAAARVLSRAQDRIESAPAQGADRSSSKS